MKEGESVEINDWDTLVCCGEMLLSSKEIAVDVEGTLRKGGSI